VAGEERCLIVGVDQETHDVVHALLVHGEDGASFERLVREAVTQAGYPLRGVVIDGSPPFLTTHAEYFPLLPLQVCRVHASRRLARRVMTASDPSSPTGSGMTGSAVETRSCRWNASSTCT